MSRFVLLRRGEDASSDDLETIKAAPGVKIIDHALRRAMLLEGTEEALIALSGQLKDWLVASEVTYSRPEFGPTTPTDDESEE